MTDDRHEVQAKTEAVDEVEATGSSRRELAGTMSKLAMGVGMAAGYGTLGAMAGRFLYPARPAERQWMYVTRVASLARDDSIVYRSPTGETINITRKAENGDASDFVALSSTCPHLGCQVHWEAQNERYFCPCHNGAFDLEGFGIEGPPGDAQQNLPRYEVSVDGGLLYIRVRVVGLADSDSGEIIEETRSRAGHDPCLDPVAAKRARRA